MEKVIYVIAERAVPTPLYAVGWKKADTDHQILVDYLQEVKNGVDRNAIRFGKGIDIVPNKQGKQGVSVYANGNRAAAKGNDLVSGGTRKGNGAGNTVAQGTVLCAVYSRTMIKFACGECVVVPQKTEGIYAFRIGHSAYSSKYEIRNGTQANVTKLSLPLMREMAERSEVGRVKSCFIVFFHPSVILPNVGNMTAPLKGEPLAHTPFDGTLNNNLPQ